MSSTARPDTLVKLPTMQPVVIDPIDGLVQKAVEAGTVDVLERLLAVKQQVHADQARAAFYTSLIGFQNECPVIGKTAQANIKPGFSYKYTPLEEIAHAIRPLLDKYQLGYRWFTAQDKQSLTVTCRISHALGHIEETSLTVPVGTDAMRPAWPVAQSLTYAKRYTLCNALGIVVGGEDDDAQEPVAEAPVAERTPPIINRPIAPLDEERATGVIAEVSVKNGTNAKTGKPWTKYGITLHDGTIYGTFDHALGKAAQDLIETTVEIFYKRDGKYLTCTGVNTIEDPPYGMGSGESDD